MSINCCADRLISQPTINGQLFSLQLAEPPTLLSPPPFPLRDAQTQRDYTIATALERSHDILHATLNAFLYLISHSVPFRVSRARNSKQPSIRLWNAAFTVLAAIAFRGVKRQPHETTTCPPERFRTNGAATDLVYAPTRAVRHKIKRGLRLRFIIEILYLTFHDRNSRWIFRFSTSSFMILARQSIAEIQLRALSIN